MVEGGRATTFELELLDPVHAICRLDAAAEVPSWAFQAPGALFSVTRSDDELSIVCADWMPPPGVERSRDWRALRVSGTLEHSLTGVLVSLAAPLAEAGIPIFAISSFDTDYLLVPEPALEPAIAALGGAGHSLG